MIQGDQVTAGVAVDLLPHAGGRWLSSLRDFLADAECTLGIANTKNSLPWVLNRIRKDDDLVRRT